MSHSYSTRTFATEENSLPSSFASLEDFKRFSQDAASAAINKPGKLYHVWGHTRSGWAIYTIKNLLKTGDFVAIQFLTDSGHQFKFEDEHGSTSVAVVTPMQQVQVIADLGRLLSELVVNPDAAYDAEEFGIYCDGDVEAALQRDYVCPNPAFDPQVLGDEGQSADYLFVYLRSVLEVTKNAHAEGLTVVHVLEI